MTSALTGTAIGLIALGVYAAIFPWYVERLHRHDAPTLDDADTAAHSDAAELARHRRTQRLLLPICAVFAVWIVARLVADDAPPIAITVLSALLVFCAGLVTHGYLLDTRNPTR